MTTAEGIDLDARYRVSYHGGIAFYLIGYATEWTEESWEYVGPIAGDGYADGGREYDSAEIAAFEDDPANYLYNEPEEIEDRTRVRAVMVGDDRVHIVDVEDLEPLDDLDYCAECGQIGCTGDFRDREEDQ